MKTPNQLRSAANEQEHVTIARRESEAGNTVTVDFGPGVEVSVDLLGESVIVVAGDRQFEFELPDEATELSTNNGMLVIE